MASIRLELGERSAYFLKTWVTRWLQADIT